MGGLDGPQRWTWMFVWVSEGSGIKNVLFRPCFARVCVCVANSSETGPLRSGGVCVVLVCFFFSRCAHPT